MASITIITIVVVALLTVIIFGLAWLGWSSCLKSYKMEVEAGKHDEEIRKEYRSKKKNKSGLVGIICSYLALAALAGLFVTGIVYKARGENLEFNNQTVLVIKSGSMADYYNEDLANEYQILNYKEYHFDIGDICVFEKVNEGTELVKGEVYGYKYKDIIITHRLIDEIDGYYKFRGDNNSTSDLYRIGKENIIYHYTGQKVPGIGTFILYAQSYFGLWSLIGIIGVAVSSEIVYHKIDKINKNRNKEIPETTQAPIEPEKPKRKIKAQFKRRDGTEVIIYDKSERPAELVTGKEPTAEAPSKTHEEKEGAEDEK